MQILKNSWHRIQLWRALYRIRQSKNSALRQVAKGRHFQELFLESSKYIDQVKSLPHEISAQPPFQRVSIQDLILFWPQAASLRLFWMVIAETLIPEHDHFYNSGLASISSTDVVLDIGACEGAFTVSAARIARRVVAIEPSRIMQQAILESAKAMKLRNVACIECLLSSENTVVGFSDNIANPLNGKTANLGEGSYNVDSLTIDQLVAKSPSATPTYIKCDAEGQDVEIIMSAAKTLRECKPKLAVATYHAPGDFEILCRFLRDLGYAVEAQGLYYDGVRRNCYPMLLKAAHPEAA